MSVIFFFPLCPDLSGPFLCQAEDGEDDADDAEDNETDDDSKADSIEDEAASVDDDVHVRVSSVVSLQNSLITFCLLLISLCASILQDEL